MKTFVIANQKGGIGKTTTATVLASILNSKGYKTLFIDADRQCNSTDTFKAQYEGKATLYDVLLEDDNERIPIKEAIQYTEAGDIVPADPLLRKADKILYDEVDGLFRLKDSLCELDGYEYVVIDTPPANNSILQSCLIAADEIIIPTTADRYSIQGLSEINATITAIRKRQNPNLKIAGILLIEYNRRVNLDKETRAALEEISVMMNTKVFESCIRKCQKVRDSQAERQMLINYSGKCTAALDYIEFTDELLGIQQSDSEVTI